MSNAYLDLLAYFGIGGAHPGGFALTQSILEDENILPTGSVLDIGCGTGQTAAYIAKKFDCNVTGIDNHPIMIEKARERLISNENKLKIRKGDAQNLDFVDDSFDLIIAESVIVFTDITKTLNELSRVLKSEGKLILIEMTAEQCLSEELQERICSLYGIYTILNEAEWIAHLQQAGFTQINIINTPSGLIQSEIDDINQSANINTDFFDLWDEHNHFLIQNRHIIGFRAFICHLS